MNDATALGEAEQIKDVLIDSVAALGREKYRGLTPDQSEHLLRLYYQRVAPQDVIETDPANLYGAAIRHWELGQTRGKGQTIVRVTNPKIDEDGWTSSHTVINVVTEDSPFIVDSILALLETMGIHVHMLAHPILAIERDESGLALAVQTDASDTSPSDVADHESQSIWVQPESYVHVEVDRTASATECEELQKRVTDTLSDVRRAVRDWHPMRERSLALAAELDEWAREAEAGSPRFQSSVGTGPTETAELLRWMEAGAFTFMGYREYTFDASNTGTITSRPSSGLGVLSQQSPTVRSLSSLPEATAAIAGDPHVLNLTKANTNATIHRSVPLDYVGIKELNAAGEVTGERRFLGLFTSNVYSGRVQDIPVIRKKVDELIRRADFSQGSHDRSRLLNALQTYPRDELFQADINCLSEMVHDVLNLRDRRQVSLLQRRDDYGRFLSCLVFVPRDRHSTDVRLAIQNILMDAYNGTRCRFSTEISNAPLARLHLVIYTDPADASTLPELAAVQNRLSHVIRSWDDDLRASLVSSHGEDTGLERFSRFREAFSASYRNDVAPETAVMDIDRLENVSPGSVDVRIHRSLDGSDSEMRCKLYCDDKPVTLSQFIPLLHDLGATVLDERPYEICVSGEQTRFVYDIGLELTHVLDADSRERFRQAILAVWNGKCESDGYARLVTSAELGWRDVLVLRAYAKYLIQIGARYSQSYVRDTLIQNPKTAARLVNLFAARFNPRTHSHEQALSIKQEVLDAIDRVTSLDSDRILRSFVSLIEATTRTNHWQEPRRKDRAALALKLDPAGIPDIPQPVPAAEVFVYSPRTEGVHLRSTKVARGGLRWSDRMEDFRTEILGLMKAQSVKNSVIVPAGAKGGFVAKQLPNAGRDEVMAEVVACYETFIGALLDITDNLVDGAVVPPLDVVRHDSDDSYLVVAADKGTATFSDIANGIAEARGFWLGDAFASGGSVGYDHKALAITARGAWVSVERHFRELGIDVATEPFNAVGIGDMSGDVFGNGLLRSDATQLVAAFDHRDIFIDPEPDAATSFAERQRLFDLPRSSWADYNTSLLSKGGGVFPRSAKSILISPEIVALLALPEGTTSLTPNELMQAVLLAPVDLLWNGGIGTYAKASSETNSDAGDRNNDAIRVDGKDLRCRVVGEGGNLGFTQAGRIEFALHGGRINTDAIDNSAGVDCSDHEVNLKILMSAAEADGDITRKQRNELLVSMADEVCDLVLDSNYFQTGALTVAEDQAPGMVEVHDRLMLWLEASAGLKRGLEGLPSRAELSERHKGGQGLTRPELAVLLAYTKNHLTDELTESTLPHDPEFDETISHYFPTAVTERFSQRTLNHPLRNELVSMLVANDLVNRAGITMVHRLMGETSATVGDIARAHIAAWQIYDLTPLFNAVNDLDNVIPAKTQTELTQEIKRLGERATRWLLRNEPQPLQIEQVVATYRTSIRTLDEMMAEETTDEETEALVQGYVAAGVPEALARSIALLGKAFGSLDLSHVAGRTGSDLSDIAGIHASVDNQLELHWLRGSIINLPRDDHWQTLARSALRDEFFSEQAELTATIATWADEQQLSHDEEPQQETSHDLVARWLSSHKIASRRCRHTFSEIRSEGAHDLARVSVALRALRQLSRAR